jgi:hypothetical protein
MKGDFTRDTFDRNNRYSRVLMQQGRVQLDADWNEQAAIMLHQLRSLAVDLIGPAWAVGGGFQLQKTPDGNDFTIKKGRFYVDGIACELAQDLSFLAQPGLSDADRHWSIDRIYLIYIDVWERLVTAAEHDALREVALGGADTTARAQIAWQVRLLPILPDATGGGRPENCQETRQMLASFMERTPPRLYAWAKDDASDQPCEIAPDASYRGPENQLYRVEIHDPGVLNVAGSAPTFKWSRDNGSVLFPVLDIDSGDEQLTVKLAHLGHDERGGLAEGQWVELVDDPYLYQERHDNLLRVAVVDEQTLTVRLTGAAANRPQKAEGRVLRRWDQRKGVNGAGVIAVKETSGTTQNAFALEDGVMIRFESGGQYRTGDYWLIPARTAIADVEWPTITDASGKAQPVALEPHGVEHHYGLLGRLESDDGWLVTNCQCSLPAGLLQCPE